MLVDVTRYHMEMASPDQLVPGRPPPVAVEMERLGPTSASTARTLFQRIGVPHHWTGRHGWTGDDWTRHLSRPDIRAWLARTGGEGVGMVELEAHPEHDVEIITLGLVSEFVGKGFGGYLLTEATRSAWEMDHPDGQTTARVWLHTNTLDHPHAKPNYERRGFRVFRTEHVRREIPD